MKVIWPLAAAASLYGAIAGSFFDDAPLMGIAFALLGVIFAVAAYWEITKN